MRKRFEQQLRIGQRPISDLRINPKSANALDHLLAGLQAVYLSPEYNREIFRIMENRLFSDKDLNNGREGMDLWTLFVLAQVRMCNNCGYAELHRYANNDKSIRILLGVETTWGYEDYEFEYQHIYDNVSLLSDEILKEINEVIVRFGHGEVFKKKESTALALKTDSFVVESNVHFPTDYNLLWDCLRKTLDIVQYFRNEYAIEGWRKIEDWRYRLKSLMRDLGRASAGGGKNKQERMQAAASAYLLSSMQLLKKIEADIACLPVIKEKDVIMLYFLDEFIKSAYKQIDLTERRILKGERIPHEEKIFSIFETYTEWITKGKLRPGVELGKKVAVTADQYGLIVHHKVMEHEQDRDIVITIADSLLAKYRIKSWSFDKGFWSADNRELLRLEVDLVVMPKLGRLDKEDNLLEKSPLFKKLRNKHSAIESHINELEHRGLDRCPDRGYAHFKSYIASAVCAYNLKKIGKRILQNQLGELQKNAA